MLQTEPITFEKVPEVLGNIIAQQTAQDERLQAIQQQIEKLVCQFTESVINGNVPDRWFDIDGLTDYLPDHPTKQTIYSWVHFRKIPYCKRGKNLLFRKSDIDEWITTGRRKTVAEMQSDAKKMLNRNKNCK